MKAALQDGTYPEDNRDELREKSSAAAFRTLFSDDNEIQTGEEHIP